MDNQPNGVNGEVKGSGKMKLLSVIVVVVIVLSAVSGAYFFISSSDDTFFVSGLGSSDSNVTFKLCVSKKPKLDKETTISWKSSYEETGNTVLATHPQVLDFILPNGIQLVEGDERLKIYPGDPLDFTWTIKAIEIGDFYIKFGSCYWANETLMENDALGYFEVGEGHGLYYATYLLGVQVANNDGSILEPERAMEATYEFSNYNTTEETNGETSYTYDIGDIVWLNVTVDAICDIPMIDTEIFLPATPVITDHLEPLSSSFSDVINLTEGSNVLNYEFRVVSHMPSDTNNARLTLRTQGTLAVFGQDSTYPVEQCNLYFTLLTNSASSTRSAGKIEASQSLAINEEEALTSIELEWNSYESDGITKAELQVCLALTESIDADVIKVLLKSEDYDKLSIESREHFWNTETTTFNIQTILNVNKANDTGFHISLFNDENDQFIMEDWLYVSNSGGSVWINESVKKLPSCLLMTNEEYNLQPSETYELMSSSEGSIKATYSFSVSGRIQYTDRYGTLMPLRRALIRILDKDGFLDPDDIFVDTTTDENGYYSTTTYTSGDSNGPDLYIMVISSGQYAQVKTFSDNFYKITSDVIDDWAGGNCPIDLEINDADYQTTVGVCRILDSSYEVGKWFDDTSIDTQPPPIIYEWERGNDADGPAYWPACMGGPYIVLDGDGYEGNGQSDYPDMIIHEYGHYLTDYLMDWTLPEPWNPYTGTPDDIDYSYKPDICDHDPINIAFYEGIAYYISSVSNTNLIDADSRYSFWNASMNGGLGATQWHDFETRQSNFLLETQPPAIGEDVIMNIAATLVDISDYTPNEINSYNGVNIYDTCFFTDNFILGLIRPDYTNSPFREFKQLYLDWYSTYSGNVLYHFPKIAFLSNDISSFGVNINTVPAITFGPIPSWGGGVIDITTQVSDEAEDLPYQTITYQYSLNGATWYDIGTDTSMLDGSSSITWNTAGISQSNVKLRVRTFDDMEYSTWVEASINIDNTIPGTPTISCPTHTVNQWSFTNDPRFTWTDVSDSGSSMAYYYVCDQTASTIPSASNSFTNILEKSYTNINDGTWYFHLRTRDDVGNWGNTVHFGPILINAASPNIPFISSSTHTENIWSANTNPQFSWLDVTPISGVTYYYVLDNNALTIPSNGDSYTTLNTLSYTGLADSTCWYFHVRAKSGAGAWSSADHFGPIKITTGGPMPQGIPTEGSPDKDWGSGEYTLFWNDALSLMGPVVSYEIYENGVLVGSTTSTSFLISGKNIDAEFYTYQIRGQNSLGTWGELSQPSDGITIDSIPPATTTITKVGVWDISNPTFQWSWPTDSGGGVAGGSGVAYFEWKVDSGVPGTTNNNMYKIPAQAPGDHIFYMRAVDYAGNEASWSSCSFHTKNGLFGHVGSGDTGAYISGATVEIYGDNDNLVATTTTDAVGNFEYGLLNTGDYTVIATKNGFTQDIEYVSLESEYQSILVNYQAINDLAFTLVVHIEKVSRTV